MTFQESKATRHLGVDGSLEFNHAYHGGSVLICRGTVAHCVHLSPPNPADYCHQPQNGSISKHFNLLKSLIIHRDRSSILSVSFRTSPSSFGNRELQVELIAFSFVIDIGIHAVCRKIAEFWAARSSCLFLHLFQRKGS